MHATNLPLFLIASSLLAFGSNERPKNAVNLSTLPPSAWTTVSAALGRDDYSYYPRESRNGINVANAAQSLSAKFTSTGTEFRCLNSRWKLKLNGYGYGGALRTVATVNPHAHLNRVEYRRGEVTEWYVNGPVGLEQGFTIGQPPGQSNGQPLTVALTVSGNLNAILNQDHASLRLIGTGPEHSEYRYSGLVAHDVTGRELRAWLDVNRQILLRVDDTNARYPIVIDPWIQLGEFTASDGGTEFGSSVAIAGDTVVVGVGENGQEAAYVFAKPSTGWTNMTQSARLTPSNQRSDDHFGLSVSIRGNTVIVGAPGADRGHGAAYVFVKPSGGWEDMTQSAELTASGGVAGDLFGNSVAMGEGVVTVGAPGRNHGQGAAYVFVNSNGNWKTAVQAATLTASDGKEDDELGFSVGIDGGTVVAGAIQNGTGAGVAYLFVEPAGGWSSATQTAELLSNGASKGDEFGSSVSVSGNTVVVGAPLALSTRGTAYVFVEPENGWRDMSETTQLVVVDQKFQRNQELGVSVSISYNTVVVGSPGVLRGAAYVYTMPTGGWITKPKMYANAKLLASDGGNADALGTAVSVSGKTIVTGAPGATVNHNPNQGKAYVFGR
jgi:uncharacterized protein (DUF2345 family)